MFNVCPHCGLYSDEKTIDPRGPFAICPACGYQHRFVQLPLFIVTGASGAGKSAIALALAPALPECVVLDSDILWRPEFATPADQYRSYRNMWLRVAKNIGQAGRPVVLCGTALPEQFESCPERRYFTALHYLALVCDDAVLMHRLAARPPWRGADTTAFIQAMVTFNQWLKMHAATTNPPLSLLDTTGRTIEHTVALARDWIRPRLA
ncbi:MAG TPA: AAA family ATPase [Herpetosiphonaceae bacterium]